jgi:hypothetical protein
MELPILIAESRLRAWWPNIARLGGWYSVHSVVGWA